MTSSRHSRRCLVVKVLFVVALLSMSACGRAEGGDGGLGEQEHEPQHGQQPHEEPPQPSQEERDAAMKEIVATFQAAIDVVDKNGDGKVTVLGYSNKNLNADGSWIVGSAAENDELYDLFHKLQSDWERADPKLREHLTQFVVMSKLNGRTLTAKEVIASYDIFMNTLDDVREKVKRHKLKKIHEQDPSSKATIEDVPDEKFDLQVDYSVDEKDSNYGEDLRCSRCEKVAEELYTALSGAARGEAVGRGDRKFKYLLTDEWSIDEMLEDVCRNSFTEYRISEYEVDPDGTGKHRRVERAFVKEIVDASYDNRPDSITERMQGVCANLAEDHLDWILQNAAQLEPVSQEDFTDGLCLDRTINCEPGEGSSGRRAIPMPAEEATGGESAQNKSDRKKKQNKNKNKKKQKDTNDDDDLFHEEL